MVRLKGKATRGPGALLTAKWGKRSYLFGVECRRLGTPKIVAATINLLQRNVGTGMHPLLLVPYLREEQLAELETMGVSGIDLCGNGVIVIKDELLVYRTGFPNRFPQAGPIKNVYRRNSSIAARVFLLVPEFASVRDALAEIRRRGGSVTLATVSKVCDRLDEDLIIERKKGAKKSTRRLRLLQPEKLLDLLAENYQPVAEVRTFRGKCNLRAEELQERLTRWEAKSGGRVVLTGASSVQAYAVMAREPVQSFYCSDLDSLLKSLGDVQATDRFANVAFVETRDDVVYFDRRPDLVASPVQTYLELRSGGKRERETAEQVRRVILDQLTRAGGKG